MREFDHEIAALHGQVAVISFARPDRLKNFAERLGHPYLWLADPKRQSYRRLGLGRRGLLAVVPPRVLWDYTRFALQGKIWHPEHWDMAQMGGDLVFDRLGNVTLKHLGSRSDDRPSLQTIMSAFRRAARIGAVAADGSDGALDLA
ncbi:MAG: AhpC/TSA family protein [Candidatus Dormiibacterota bacterium]